MAQTGFTPIQLYSSSTPTNAPSAGNLTNDTKGSELAINIADGKLFYKDSANAVQVIGWKTTPATAGGTGQTSYAVGDLLYANTTTSLDKLADVATGNALISGGVGVAPAWGKIGLTTHVNGTLGVGNGGTGTATTFTAGSVVFAGGSGVYSQDNANLFWDDANNRLGVGTATPTRGLEVLTATAVPLRVGTGNSNMAIEFVSTAGTRTNWLIGGQYNVSGGFEITPSTAAGNTTFSTPALQILSTGNIGIGATPAARLSVDSGAAGLMATFNSTDANGGYIAGRSSGTTIWDLGTAKQAVNVGTSSDVGFATRSGFLSFGTASTEAMRIHVSRGVSIGNTTDPGAGILSVASGVRFPATQSASSDANTLDDYEEGTWTPTIAGATTAGSATYAVRTGTYTKIGDLVHVQLFLIWSGHTGTGNMLLTGLPFTSSSVSTNFSSMSLSNWSVPVTSGNVPMAYIPTSNTLAEIVQMVAGGGSTIAVPMAASGGFIAFASYKV